MKAKRTTNLEDLTPVLSIACGMVTLRTPYALDWHDAEQLANKLNLDPLFMQAEVVRARTAKPLAYVHYLPNDTDAIERMIQFFESDARERAFMEGDDWTFYAHEDEGKMWCEGTTGTYELDMRYGGECTCPDYQYRKKRVGLKCKHLERVQMIQDKLVEQPGFPA